MHALPRFLTAVTFLAGFFTPFAGFAQTDPPGGPQLSMSMLDDSLTTGSDKTTDGFYYKGIPLTYTANSRLYISYSAFGPNYKDLSIVFMNDAGKSVRYHSDEVLGTKMGEIELDTTFTSDGKTNLLFTTEHEGQTLKYSITAAFASQEAIAFNNDADFCWKIAFLIKHSDVGYRFIRTGEKRAFGTTYSTTAPIRSDAPTASSVYEGVGSISYKSTLGRGTKEQAAAFFTQVQDNLKQCMGTQFDYKTDTNSDGAQTFTCTASAPVDGTARNLSYIGKDKGSIQPKYIVTVTLAKVTVEGNELYEVQLDIKNAFYQF